MRKNGLAELNSTKDSNLSTEEGLDLECLVNNFNYHYNF